MGLAVEGRSLHDIRSRRRSGGNDAVTIRGVTVHQNRSHQQNARTHVSSSILRVVEQVRLSVASIHQALDDMALAVDPKPQRVLNLRGGITAAIDDSNHLGPAHPGWTDIERES